MNHRTIQCIIMTGYKKQSVQTAISVSKNDVFYGGRITTQFMQFTHQQMHYLLTWLKVLIYVKIHNNIAPTCFSLQ